VGRNRSQHAPARYWRQRLGSTTWQRSFKFAIVRHPFHRLVSGYTYWKNGALSGQDVDRPFVHRCRSELNTLTKFVDYLVHVNENGLWDKSDIQGYDGTCPIQFRPQVWFLAETENEHVSYSKHASYSGNGNIRSGGSEKSPLDKWMGRTTNVDECVFSSISPSSNSTTAVHTIDLIPFDFIGRYEDLTGSYTHLRACLEARQKDREQICALTDGHVAQTLKVVTSSGQCMPDMTGPLPHTRASIHPRELPIEFTDPTFVSKVVSVYGCDFEAFGYNTFDIDTQERSQERRSQEEKKR